MKFGSSDFIKMGGTAIITSLLFYFIFISPTGCSPKNLINNEAWKSWKEAMELRNNYYEHHPNPLLINDGKEKLEGFKLDADFLDKIINENPFGKPDSLIFYLGMQGKYGSDDFKMQLIAVGIKDNKLLIPQSNDETGINAVLDKAEPCPIRCPEESRSTNSQN